MGTHRDVIWTPWSEAATAELKRLYALGYSAGRTSQELTKLGFPYSRNAVIGKWHRLNLNGRAPDYKLKRPKHVNDGVKHRGTNGGHASKVLHRIKHPPKILQIAFEPPTNAAISFMELNGHTCRYPVGEATGASQLFCGAATDETWCPYHRSICWQPVTDEMRRGTKKLAKYIERIAA